MKCKICLCELEQIFHSKILKKYEIDYFYCENCGFLCTENPYWIKEAYDQSINIQDTGILFRNNRLSEILSVLIYFLYDKKKKYIDFAGGYGILVRLMRDIGFDFFWDDPFTTNLFAKGFELKNLKKNYVDVEAVTSAESFEHFNEPLSEIDKMIKISKTLIFTTELLPDPIPKPNEWAYYGLEHGQHIAFYSYKTLEYIAKQFKLNLYSVKSIHILTPKKINPFLFKVLIKLSKYGLANIIRKRMKSRMIQDIEIINSDVI